NRGHGSKNVVLPLGGGGGGSATPPRGQAEGHSEGADSAESSAQNPPPNARGNAGAAASPFGQGGVPGVTTNLYLAGFDASWDIDLFGGTRRAIEAADAAAAAAEENRRG